MQWLERLETYIKTFSTYRVTMNFYDVIEILFISVLVYYILAWMKSTRAWALLKGLIVIGIILLIADLLQMSTILWIAKNVLSFAIMALIVVLQPEIRKMLEELGQKNIIAFMIPGMASNKVVIENLISSYTIDEIVVASELMGNAKTGALIVIERNETLKEYEKSGIELDAIVTSELLINIFEHNTPLHDGAIIIRGNRVTAATCYLPLTPNQLSKELGTRHRAGVGVSEQTDSLTVIVSEENGSMSLAFEGKLYRNLTSDELRKRMAEILIGEIELEEDRQKHKFMRKASK